MVIVFRSIPSDMASVRLLVCKRRMTQSMLILNLLCLPYNDWPVMVVFLFCHISNGLKLVFSWIFPQQQKQDIRINDTSELLVCVCVCVFVGGEVGGGLFLFFFFFFSFFFAISG